MIDVTRKPEARNPAIALHYFFVFSSFATLIAEKRRINHLVLNLINLARF
jgi:hypothetical protein